MTKIAIDIAFLLPDEIEDLCVSVNQNSRRIRPLGKNDYRPHITLAMGIIEEGDIKFIQDFLQTLDQSSLNLSVDKVKYRETPDGNKSSLEVVNTSELQELHEKIMRGIGRYLRKGANVEMLYKGNETGISDNTKGWLDTFHEKTAFENYCPHITLGCYDAKIKLPLNFEVDTLALCHVGDGVTCRKVISEYRLN